MKSSRFTCLWALLLAGLFLSGCGLPESPAPEVVPVEATPAGPAERLDREKFWGVQWTVEKWRDTAAFVRGARPDERQVIEENLLLNGGINELLKLLCGTGGTAYSNANARLYVGNGSDAESASQTDLQGGSTTAKAMDATYPQVSGQTATWRATYGDSEGNHAWNEVGVLNGAPPVSGSVLLLNRKVPGTSLGTKTSGTWVLTLTLTIS